MRHFPCRPYAMLAKGLVALALSGCGKGLGGDAGKKDGPMAAGVVPHVIDSAMSPRAGQWEMHMVLEKMDMPGAMAGGNAQMRAMVDRDKPKERVGYTCLTPEQAEGGKGAMFSQAAPGCTYQKFEMGHGHIDARLHCVNAMGDLVTTMTGDYAADSYKVRVTNSGKSNTGKNIATSMTVTANRTGTCNATTRPFGTGMVGKVRP